MKKAYTADQLAKTFIQYGTFNALRFLAKEDKFRDKFLENIKNMKVSGKEYNDTFNMDVNFLAAIAYGSYEEHYTEESFDTNVKNAVTEIDIILDQLSGE